MPHSLSPVDKIRFAVRAAIVGASLRGDDGMIAVVNFDTGISATAWMIAAIGVQAKLPFCGGGLSQAFLV
jgi:hypothetical protein